MKNILQLKNVKFRVEGKEIIKGINLEIPKGEIHALIGPNGAGKTTLANLIAGAFGYEQPTEGEIIFRGKLLNGLPINERAKLGLTSFSRTGPF